MHQVPVGAQVLRVGLGIEIRVFHLPDAGRCVGARTDLDLRDLTAGVREDEVVFLARARGDLRDLMGRVVGVDTTRLARRAAGERGLLFQFARMGRIKIVEDIYFAASANRSR